MQPTRKLLICLTIILSATSCGYQITKSTTTTTTTTTTIDYGQDCNLTVDKTIQELSDAVDLAWKNATDGVPTRTEYEEMVRALKFYRSDIRTLDIPTMSVVQSELVDAIENFLNAYNTYWESGKKNLSVNDYIIPYTDARTDFTIAWDATCG